MLSSALALMAARRSIVPAVLILTLVGAAAFVVCTLAVSSASTRVQSAALKIDHRFSVFSFEGSVGTDAPVNPKTFTLSFGTEFRLAENGPSVINEDRNSLKAIHIQEAVRYPVPSSKDFVGPAKLPFGSRSLTLNVGIRGFCFPADANGSYSFNGKVGECATASLVLGQKRYKIASLLQSISGSFRPSAQDGRNWTGQLSATFRNPGYTFPVATLGRAGGTTFVIGKNGGRANTRSISFEGGRQP
jgi:hypothetical protein